jgi:transcriptional regulator with XRE-family HTH domain
MEASMMRETILPNLDLRIGLTLKSGRVKKGYSQAELANKAGVRQSFLSMVENGKANRRVRLTTLQTLAHALGYKQLSDLIVQAESMPANLDDAINHAEAVLAKAETTLPV